MTQTLKTETVEDLMRRTSPQLFATNNNGVEFDCTHITDLWHIAMRINKRDSGKVLEVWHQAHAMQDQLNRQQPAVQVLADFVDDAIKGRMGTAGVDDERVRAVAKAMCELRGETTPERRAGARRKKNVAIDHVDRGAGCYSTRTNTERRALK